MVRGSGNSSFWISTILAVASIVLVGINSVLTLVNHRAQTDVNDRQRSINESIQLKQLQDGIVRALANAANNKDDQARDLLVQLGFATVSPAPGASAPATPVPTLVPAPSPAAPATGAKN